MKAFDILDAISDLPEDYAAQCLSAEDTPVTGSVQAETKASEITVTHTEPAAEKQKPFIISRAGIAAAVAVCIGLNAALIFGISQIKRDSNVFPGTDISSQQKIDQPHMELVDAMPTGIIVKLVNNSDEEIALTDNYSVWQNGKKVADCNRDAFDSEPSEAAKLLPHIDHPQYTLAYEQLPAGQYTLCSFTEDGVSPGAFGNLDFEISAAYDEWIYVPQDCKGRTYDDLAAELKGKGLQVKKSMAACDTEGIRAGDLLGIGVEPYRTDQIDEHATCGYYHYDGSGYWVQPGDTVTIHVCNGQTSQPPKMVSYGADQPYEMELYSAQPAMIRVRLINNTFEPIEVTPYFSVWQDGRKIEDCVCLAQGENALTLGKARPGGGGESVLGLTYETLPEGTYTLRHFADDGTTPGAFGSVDFQIFGDSAQTTLRVPDVSGWDYETAKTTLLDMGFEVDKRNRYSDTVPEGCVVEALVGYDTVGSEGFEANAGDTVTLCVSLGRALRTIEMPDLVGLDWKTAKRTAEENGILLARQLADSGSDGGRPGTVTVQFANAGDQISEGAVVAVLVVKDESAHDACMYFSMPAGQTGDYYISVRNAEHENIGNSPVFKADGAGQIIHLYAECGEQDTPVQAFLVNAATRRECIFGSYILHPDSAAYETVYEDIAGAFRQL